MFSPLEQFEINVISPCSIFLTIFSLTNLNLFLLFSFVILNFLLILILNDLKIYSNNYLLLLENIKNFVLEIVKQQASRSGLLFFPVFFYLFLFLALINLIGLFPLSFTPTAHIVVTLTLALSFNISFLLYGFYLHNIKFLKLFVPSGAPKMLLPLIVVIEVISYLIRSFSLALRLFANLMAGHTLLHILMGFVISLLNFNLFFSIIPYVIIIFINLLELVIAVLQAYVFIVLLSIYLGDSLNPGH